MELYLVQHGEAKSKTEDPQRPLTKRGRDEVQRVAAFAAKAGLKVSQVRHSGKRRAEETASILAERLSPAEGVLANLVLRYRLPVMLVTMPPRLRRRMHVRSK